MKKLIFVLVIVAMLATASVAAADNGGKFADCTTIQEGLVDSHGNPLVLGYDQWGYNYQASIFNGLYDNVSRPAPPVTESDTWLQMKWNDAWLSNKDCDGDGLLDRHYGHTTYVGSGAWLTNHMWGWDENGQWTYFVKIVAAPEDATKESGIWYAADGTEIGPVIWGSFAIIQEVESGGGATYVSPTGPGLGKW